MKDNILLIAHNNANLNLIAKLLSKELSMRTLDFNKYVEYNLGRDEEFVIKHLGLEYYWEKYYKNYEDLEDFQDALVVSNLRVCLAENIFKKLIKDLYIIVIDISIKEQEKEINQYISTKSYIYKSKKTKLMNNFRYLKTHADLVVKYNKDCENTVNNIISHMMEEINND